MGKQVVIPDELYEKIERSLPNLGFQSVDEYVIFVLQEVLRDESGEVQLSPEEEEAVKKRLRDLGYLD